MVNFYGYPVATLQSRLVLSSLFGQAVKLFDSGWVYIDVPRDELSFSGSTTTLGSFTVGMFIYRPASLNQVMFCAINMHSIEDTDLYSNYRFSTTTNPGRVNFQQQPHDGFTREYPDMKLADTGWKHVVFSYEASRKQLDGYVDGTLLQSSRIKDRNANGNEGAYVSVSFKFLKSLFIFHNRLSISNIHFFSLKHLENRSASEGRSNGGAIREWNIAYKSTTARWPPVKFRL